MNITWKLKSSIFGLIDFFNVPNALYFLQKYDFCRIWIVLELISGLFLLLGVSKQCYSITILDLIVLTTPLIEQPNDLEVCDDDTDGVAIFDLTDGGNTQALLLNLIDPVDWPNYTITYYEDAGLTVPIGNPEVYFNIPPSPQTIYIVVEDISQRS